MSKGAATRERILDQAVELTSLVGLEGLSIGGLAKATEMSKSGLFAHFASKKGLQLRVIETARARFIEAVVSPALRRPRGELRLRALFENWLEWEKERTTGGCPFVAAAHEMDDRPGPVRDALVASQRDWIDTLATAARIAVEEGHLARDLDVRQLAYDVYGLFLAYHLYHRLLLDPEAARRARAGFERLLDASR